MSNEKEEEQMLAVVIIDSLEVEQYWDWLFHNIKILENLVINIENNLKLNKRIYPKHLFEIRMAERTFNFYIDSFIETVVARSKETSFTEYLIKKHKDQYDNWKKIKMRRDKVASRISDIIESNSEYQKEYEKYCESLKKLRLISSFL